MSSPRDTSGTIGRAEQAFREAFGRLKVGKPTHVPKGTPVSQNNVAKEAGCDPSALRKSRYPSLIAEIQRWVEEDGAKGRPSPRQALMAQRSRNRTLREKMEAMKAQRDKALALLVEADATILDLAMENARLQSLLPGSNVTSMRKAHEKR